MLTLSADQREDHAKPDTAQSAAQYTRPAGHPPNDQRFRRGAFLGCVPGGIDSDGDVVLDGDGEERWWVDLEVGKSGGDGSGDVVGVAVDVLVEGDVGVVGGVAGELYLEIAVEGGGVDGGFGKTKADGDDGELRAAGDLEHVQVAIAVAGVEGLDGDGEEKVAGSGVADSFAFGGVAGGIDLVDGMRHVIGEGGLVEEPGVVLLREGRREKSDKDNGGADLHGTPTT